MSTLVTDLQAGQTISLDGPLPKTATVATVTVEDSGWVRLGFTDGTAVTTRPTRTVTVTPNPTPESGTYLIGLPVVVTVGEDGSVTFAVCVEDAATALREDNPDGVPAAHLAAVETATEALTYTVASA